MDILVAVLRPKHTLTILSEYRPKNFDILLVDIRTKTNDKSKTIKQLPKCSMSSYNQDAGEVVGDCLYHLTGSESGGLKAKRSLHIPTLLSGEQRESYMKGSLFCLIVDSKDKLNPSHVDNIPSTPGFYQLDYVFDSCRSNSVNYARQTKFMIQKLEGWLKERYSIPGAIEVILRPSVKSRVRQIVNNPACGSKYVMSSVQSQSSSGIYSNASAEELQAYANEALTKMMAIEKCDIVVINNLYGQKHKHKVDALAVNRYWGLRKPDLSKIGPVHQSSSDMRYISSYPLHHYACKGDVYQIRILLQRDVHLATQLDRNLWAPIHYAASYGKLDAVRVLLEESDCSPNILTENQSTPLHFAAQNGHPLVVRYLLEHKDIDVNALDGDGRSALDICDKVLKPKYKDCAMYIKTAKERPYQKIKVYLMDTKQYMLDLVSGDNTTVQQLHDQMLRVLKLPQEVTDMFTIWICSKNLQLQLKWDHRPKQHIKDWRQIVKSLTDCDISKEPSAKLYWKRDARRLSIMKEKMIKNETTTHLLFHEAYICYIKGLYPCAEQDGIILGAMIMQLEHGNYDSRKSSAFFGHEQNLFNLVPQTLVKSSGKSVQHWCRKVRTKYKQLSAQLTNATSQFLHYHFLVVCWNLKVYGAAFFIGYIIPRVSSSRHNSLPEPVHIGVNDIGIHIIHGKNKVMLHTFDYKQIDWRVTGEHGHLLAIQLKDAPRNQSGLKIHTKQAELIEQLMVKLKGLNTTAVDI